MRREKVIGLFDLGAFCLFSNNIILKKISKGKKGSLSVAATLNSISKLAGVAACLFSCAVFGIDIDGKLDEPEWDNARPIEPFTTVEPYSLSQPKLRTEAKIFTDEKGIYIGVINHQPEETQRIENVQRDGNLNGDHNKIVIDFDNNRSAAYSFEVANGGSIFDGIWSDENQLSSDWDGSWEAATTAENDHWVSEVFIPWDVAPMASVQGEKREIGLHLVRWVPYLGETYASSPTSRSRSQFLSEIRSTRVNNFSGSSFKAFVSGTARRDMVANESHYNLSLETFWKPNSSKQISLALNPDFGQVESDNLVVNFSPDETFFSEKRPFFTENQSLFDLRGSKGLRLLHTRRMGGPSDGGNSQVMDIDAALKFTSNGESLRYGLLGVTEGDVDNEPGRDFFAGRVSYKNEDVELGYLMTHAERPTLKRRATVQALDYTYKLNKSFKLSGQLIGSDVATHDIVSVAESDLVDYAGWAKLSHQVNNHLVQSVELSRYGDEFEVNDMGFLSRNNFTSFEYSSDLKKPVTKKGSSLSARHIETRAEYMRSNDGVELAKSIRAWYGLDYKSTASFWLFGGAFASVEDDRFTRGNRVLAKDPGYYIGFYYRPPKTKLLRYHYELEVGKSTTGGTNYMFHIHPTYSFNDNVSMELSAFYRQAKDWLLWQGNNDINSYDRKLLESSINLNAKLSQNQDIRLKFQWFAMSAAADQAFEVDTDGALLLQSRELSDFTLSDTALQVRYKYQLGPLSNIYLVYSRGASARLTQEESVFSVFSEGWKPRKGDNVLLKIRYLI